MRQFDGFAPGQRVFGGDTKMPIGAVGNPNYGDFANPKEAAAAKTHHLSGIINRIRKESPTAYFSGELNLNLNKRLRGS